MPRGPAARLLDPVVHPLPGMLMPGPASFDVIIGNMLAWRGVPTAAAAAITAAKAVSDTAIAVAEAATVAAAVPPALGLPAAKTAEELVKSTAAAAMGSLITSAAGGADIHSCLTPLPIPPHGPGVVIDGSPTVFINGLPACRQLDTIIEAVGPPDKILVGCPTVIIGDAPNPTGHGSLVYGGSEADREQLDQLVETIRRSGPQGKAFVEQLEAGPQTTRLFIGTTATRADGTVVNLASTGGGVTLRPTESPSGDNEVHVDPTNLINYNATDGTTERETRKDFCCMKWAMPRC